MTAGRARALLALSVLGCLPGLMLGGCRARDEAPDTPPPFVNEATPADDDPPASPIAVPTAAAVDFQPVAISDLIGRGPLTRTPAKAGSGSGPPPRAPRVVYWYTIDALRADVPRTRRNGRPLMPELEAFATEAVEFSTCYSLAPNTLIATASMFTGLFPPRHGVLPVALPVRGGGTWFPLDLDARFVTLAEYLRGRGYETRTHLYTVFVRPGSGLLQGFDELELPEEVDGPLFVYEHHLGLHAPYEAPPEVRRRFGLEPPRLLDPGSPDWYALPVLGDAERDELWNAYLAEGYLADRHFGRRMRWLREKGAWDDALVIVTADHGEEFLEHGGIRHGTLYEEIVRVPLYVKFPRGSTWAALHGRVFPHRVSVADIFPTLIALLGGEAPPYEIDGRSLLPILAGDETDPRERPAVLRVGMNKQLEGFEGDRLLVHDAVLSGSLKAIFGYRLQPSRTPETFDYRTGDWFAELYDLETDPRERKNLAAARRDDFFELVELHRRLVRPLTPAARELYGDLQGAPPTTRETCSRGSGPSATWTEGWLGRGRPTRRSSRAAADAGRGCPLPNHRLDSRLVRRASESPADGLSSRPPAVTLPTC